ncbi:DUF3667 domain-containing protein [Spirosoma rhododendri]|uniref:DUF3667 domain-containing protein n=1 Tax=Spirosoma rhododendri TaxID=2728024 RepID=A0A7L5DX62_9BACT|nr:DUF3667 domain-containing protein [Spirosoma rhododendri]QJD81238.1 DUF3667 domain-containing protein [Spirosoma rhododendri]
MSAHHKLDVCPNCGTHLGHDANFCPNCGQENHEVKLPLSHIGYEFVESITHFDNKLWNSLKAIFTRPGQMTAEFLEGKRARYVPPARLYVFVSVLFFFLVGKFASHQIESTSREVLLTTLADDVSKKALGGETGQKKDSLLASQGLDKVATIEVDKVGQPAEHKLFYQSLTSLPAAGLDSLLRTQKLPATGDNRAKLTRLLTLIRDEPTTYPVLVLIGNVNENSFSFPTERERRHFLHQISLFSDEQLDSTLTKNRLKTGYFGRMALRKANRITEISQADDIHTVSDELSHVFIKSLSTTMFVLMPFVAFLLWLFYVRRKQYRRYYYEHLVFSIHAHTVLFLFLSIALLIAIYLEHYVPESVVTQILFWAVVVSFGYFLLSLKRVYNQTWLRTVGKFVLISGIYLVTVMLFMIVVLGLSANSL